MFEEIDNELASFIKNYIDSFTAWDIFVYYFGNSNKILSIKQLSELLGRREEEVEKVVEKLAKKNIFRLSDEGEIKFTPKSRELYLLKRFVAGIKDGDRRLEIMALVFEK
ncbi:MAG: hypothetical protein M1371_07915 [Actinobacteria bacterium]|nr:hypothetical protein [Actinomycetota bacterium]